MTYMFELYYPVPPNPNKEAQLRRQLGEFGGRLDFREEIDAASVCLTFEFDDLDAANQAAERLRAQGEHVEGPMDYAS